jgi:hypothetical protein
VKLQTSRNELAVTLFPLEQLASLHLGALRVPREQIDRAHVDVPRHGWQQLRVPGAFIPGVVKAGIYVWTERREFWMTHRWQPERLVIELKEFARYDRLVLSVADADEWADKINAWLGDAPPA